MDEEDQLDTELCSAAARHDPVAFIALLNQHGFQFDQQVTHSKYAIEYAIEADSLACFDATLAWGRLQAPERNPMDLRLWGGQTPIHRCALHNTSNESRRGAPQCLARALKNQPELACVGDDEKRTTLDWAAMSSNPEVYSIALASVLSCKHSGIITDAYFRTLVSQSAFCAVNTGRVAKNCIQKLDAIESAGIDWRTIEHVVGHGLLGSSLDNPLGRIDPELPMKLLDRGADPMSPWVKESLRLAGYGNRAAPNKIIPCALIPLDPIAITGIDEPVAMRLAMECPEEAFMERVQGFIRKFGPDVYRIEMAEDQPQLASAIMARFQALEEAKALRAASPELANKPKYSPRV